LGRSGDVHQGQWVGWCEGGGGSRVASVSCSAESCVVATCTLRPFLCTHFHVSSPYRQPATPCYCLRPRTHTVHPPHKKRCDARGEAPVPASTAHLTRRVPPEARPASHPTHPSSQVMSPARGVTRSWLNPRLSETMDAARVGSFSTAIYLHPRPLTRNREPRPSDISHQGSPASNQTQRRVPSECQHPPPRPTTRHDRPSPSCHFHSVVTVVRCPHRRVPPEASSRPPVSDT